MADEIGSNLNGAVTQAAFAGDQVSPVGLSAIRTAGAGETVTNVKYRLTSVGTATTVSIGLYAVNGSDQPTGAPIYTRVAIVTGGTNGLKQSAVSWALTEGTRYVLAASLIDSVVTFTATTQANGTSIDDGTAGEATFTHRSYGAVIVDIAGDITVAAGGASIAVIMQNYRNMGIN